MTSERDALAAAWAEHLRDGGTTPWSEWPGQAPAPSRPGPSSSLPGAAQLELLRSLNVEGPLPALVDHVLRRPGPGRGLVSLPLPWPPRSEPAPKEEVVRVGLGVLADLTVRLPAGEAPAAPHRPRRRPGGAAGFALDGLPVTVAALRAELAAAGVLEHRPRRSWFGGTRQEDPALLLVVVGPLADSLRQAWSRRVQEGSGRSWPRFVAARAARDLLPPSADHLDTVARWSPRIGAENVHVVTADRLRDVAASLLGATALGGTAGAEGVRHLPGDPLRVDPALLDVLRRLNQVLPFLVDEPERSDRRSRLVRLMSQERLGPDVVTVPAEQREWLASTAARMAEGLASSGCRVHGDLALLGAPEPRGAARVGPGEVLAALVRMIHRVDAEAAPGQGGSR